MKQRAKKKFILTIQNHHETLAPQRVQSII